jgi:uncharacterized membrane protein HdeD (DUF308 family)
VTDLYGKRVDYSSTWQRKNLVLVMLSDTDPLSRSYADQLMARSRDSKADDTEWVVTCAPSARERPGDGVLTVFSFSGSWWVPVVRGAMAVVFGLLAFTLAVTTLAGVILAFGLYALVDGLFAMAAALASRTTTRDWWILLLQGVLGVAVGLATLFYPILTALLLLSYVAAWAVVLGGLQVYGAIRLRREISFEWWLALGGIASVAFGILLLLRPIERAVASLWVIAGYFVASGVMLMLGGLSTRTRTSVTRAA